MRSIDTNIILRLLLLDLPEEVEKINYLIRSEPSGNLLLDDVVLFEVVWVLSGPGYRLSRTTVAQALLKIAAVSQIKCNRPLLFKALPLYVKHPKLSFVDICLTVYAELNDAKPLLTLDQVLARQLPTARLLSQDFAPTR